MRSPSKVTRHPTSLGAQVLLPFGPATGMGSMATEREDLHATFDQWLHDESFRPRTVALYRALWRSFLDYCEAVGKRSFYTIDTRTVGHYLASRHSARRDQRIRYRRFLERAIDAVLCLQAQRLAGEDSRSSVGGHINPAVRQFLTALKETAWEQAPANNPTQFLCAHEQASLRTWCRDEFARAGAATLPGARSGQRLAAKPWREARDALIVWTLLKTGVTSLEVSNLAVSCISDGPLQRMTLFVGQTSDAAKVRAARLRDTQAAYTGEDAGGARILALPAGLGQALREWTEINRAGAPLPCEALKRMPLFPSTTPGGRAALTRDPLCSKATIARAVAEVGRSALGKPITARLLRNSFGASLLENGADDGELARQMGYIDGASSAARFRLAWERDRSTTAAAALLPGL